MANIDREGIPAERLHPKAANARCRPISDIRGPELVAQKLPVVYAPGPPTEDAQKRAFTGRQHSERLGRSPRLETVRAHQFGSLAYPPYRRPVISRPSTAASVWAFLGWTS